MSVITQKTVKVTITARQESLIIRPEGGDIEAVVFEAKRQMDLLVSSHWKWVRFPVVVDLCVEVNGKESNFPSFIVRNMRDLIERSKIILDQMLR